MKRAFTAGSILLASIILLAAAFYNGYPLATADIGTYLTLTKPKYIWLHIRSSLIGTYLQLTRFAIGDGNSYFSPESHVLFFMKQHVPGEVKAFSTSAQNKGDLLPVPVWQSVIHVSVYARMVLLLLGLHPFIWRNLKMRTILITLVAGVVINAWDCATFANAIDRLGARMMWVIVLADLAMIGMLVSYYAVRRSQMQQPKTHA